MPVHGGATREAQAGGAEHIIGGEDYVLPGKGIANRCKEMVPHVDA
ncbi:MAG: hypothetical protein QF785_12240 [Phycisphaeraceae bacterium]|jgi:hypothetical protein|nr:hypothetical protein [Phycisphaeraceae bacterium]